MDLASAYVLCPLNYLVLDFEACGRGQMNKQKSRGILDRSFVRGDLESEGRRQDCQLS